MNKLAKPFLWLHLKTGLLAKLFVPLALFSAVIIILVAVLAYQALFHEITLQYDQRARGAASLLSYEIAQEDLLNKPLLLTQDIQQLSSFYSDFYRISVFAPDGSSYHVIASSDPGHVGREAEQSDLGLMRTGQAFLQEVQEDGRHVLEIRYPIFSSLSQGGQPVAFLGAYTSLVERDYKLGSLVQWIVIISALAFLLLPALIYIILRVTTLTPLWGLVGAAKRVNAGDLHAQIPDSSPKEVPDKKIRFELPIVIRAFNAMIEQIRQDQQELHDLSIHDSLTGLFTRGHFDDVADGVRYNAIDTDQSFAIIMVAVMGMKEANTRSGHTAGDKVLRRAADFLKENATDGDQLFRWGGAEILLLTSSTGLKQVKQRVEGLKTALKEWNSKVQDPSARLSLCIGYADWESHENMESVLRAAGESMYKAKVSNSHE